MLSIRFAVGHAVLVVTTLSMLAMPTAVADSWGTVSIDWADVDQVHWWHDAQVSPLGAFQKGESACLMNNEGEPYPVCDDPDHYVLSDMAWAAASPGMLRSFSGAVTDGKIDPLSMSMWARSDATWIDSISLYAPAGVESVRMRFSGVIHYDQWNTVTNLDLAPPFQPTAGGSAEFKAFILWTWGVAGQQYWGEQKWEVCSGCSSASVPGVYEWTYEVDVDPLREIGLNMSVSTRARAYLYNYVADGVRRGGRADFAVDAGNTSLTGFEILTPGVTFESDSGWDYKFVNPYSQVPEPGALGLLGLGLAGLAATRRRKQ